MSESQLHSTPPPVPEDGPAAAPAPAPAAGQDYSAILADIDDILQENALDFVRGFVQEGGQ